MSKNTEATIEPNINKTCRIGTLEDVGNLYISIKLNDGKLSITGVEGPMRDGDARGGCGQIDMHYKHRDPADDDPRSADYNIDSKNIDYAPGWDAEKWLDLLDIWSQWHLNDMRAGCEHQHGADWKPKTITLYYWRLNSSVEDHCKEAKKLYWKRLIAGETVTMIPSDHELMDKPDKVTTSTSTPPSPLYEPNTPRYENDHHNKPSEDKQSNWVKPEEHPDGLLCKPCPTCGYKYGSAWNSEAIPPEIVEFLDSLRETDKTPAWV